MISSSAYAQVGGGLAEDIKACRAIPDIDSRLYCYDQIADSMSEREARQAEDTKRAVAAAKEVAEQNFGLREDKQTAGVKSNTQVTEQTKAILEAAQDPNEISAEITKVELSRNGKKVIYLSNDQIWVETSASKLRNKPKVGETAIIKKEGLGWFRVRFSKTYGIMAARRIK